MNFKVACAQFLQLMSSRAPNLCGPAVGALRDIDVAVNVLNEGMVQSLIYLIKQDITIPCLREVTAVILKLCGHENLKLSAATVHEILSALCVFIDHTDTDVLVNTIRAIHQICDAGYTQIVIESGVVPKCIPLMGHAVIKVQTAALGAVCKIAKGSDDQIQLVLNNDALSYFPVLLSHPKEKSRRKALMLLSYITAGNQSGVQAAINSNIVPNIIENLRHGELRTQEAAVLDISNMLTAGNREQIFALIELGVIPALCDFIRLVCNI